MAANSKLTNNATAFVISGVCSGLEFWLNALTALQVMFSTAWIKRSLSILISGMLGS